MICAGVDRATAKLISGHRTDSMFDRYNIQDEKDLAHALEKRAACETKLSKNAEDSRHRKTVRTFKPEPV